MIKRALLGMAAFVSLAAISNSSAGELAPIPISNEFQAIDDAGFARTFAFDRSDVFETVDASTLIDGLPVLALMDNEYFPVETPLTHVAALPRNAFPLTFATVNALPKMPRTTPDDSKDATAGLTNNRDKVYDMGGEVGFLVGKSIGSGHRSAEMYGGYIEGGIGNDKVQVTGGMSYQETNFRWSRQRP